MTAQNQIKNIYGFDFPSDFFSFYKFIERINNDKELVGEYNKGLGLLGMYPGKIFDVFNSDFNSRNLDLIKEGRYEADPPEFFTVLQGDTDGLHWGYYFDAPSTQTVELWVASYYARDAFSISANNHTLFEEAREQLESL
ncbi:MAG: ADP-ribosylation family protein, partial [Saprospiraceae bacterium]